MSDNHNIPEDTAEQIPGPRSEVLLNLRQSQAKNLQQLAAAVGLSRSDAFQQLIDLANLPETDRHTVLLGSAELANRVIPALSNSKESNWTQVPIYLDEQHFNGLCSLAEKSGVSKSKKMRDLLANYITSLADSTRSRKHEKVAAKPWGVRRHKTRLIVTVTVALTFTLACLFLFLNGALSVKANPHWAGARASIIFDHHTHTRSSDGKLEIEALVKLAVEGGCDALVISDHTDKRKTVSDQQLKSFQDLRLSYPDLLLFGGMELNMPSYGGREHIGVIADPMIETKALPELKELAERTEKDVIRNGLARTSDTKVLQLVADYQSEWGAPLLIYNHPSRYDHNSEENFSDIKKWTANAPVFTAISGAPGHQNARVTGDYKKPLLTVDRWDPAVAVVGGAWDQLLSQNHQIWGALASSDFHKTPKDAPPCAFSRTHLAVPERSYRGVINALKAGTFWADHGRILDQLWFSVGLDGSEEIAYPGSSLTVGDSDSVAMVGLLVERGPGSVGLPLTVEIIGNCGRGGAKVLAELALPANRSSVFDLIPVRATDQAQESCFLRARVRLVQATESDFMAYTNPIRLRL
jgi:hypothetical protein